MLPEFVVQFGINRDPAIQRRWRDKTIEDDPVVASNLRGYVTCAKTRVPDSRTVQLFIKLNDNSTLDKDGFAPFAHVVEGMDVVAAINAEYGQTQNQVYIQQQGNNYLNPQFPNLDYRKIANIVEDADEVESSAEQ